MAKVDVTIKCECCGKSFTHTGTVYKASERDSYEAWARKTITTCAECRAAQKNANNAAAVAEFEFPALTGSEKQIAWAQTLRNAVVKKMTDIRSRYTGAEDNFTVAIKYIIANHTESAWWIDHRFAGEQELTAILSEAFDKANA